MSDSAGQNINVVFIIIFICSLLIRKTTAALLRIDAFTRATVRRLRQIVTVTFIFVLIIIVALWDALTFILKEEVVTQKLLLLVQLTLVLVNTRTEGVGIPAECNI
jgi:sterol desaturase/sphingolipid hydroxylase (fatty acid hydroxylase superfamily)